MKVERVRKMSWTESARGLGTLEPWRQVVIKAETAGRVLKINAEVGQKKKKKEVVARVDVSTAYTIHRANKVAINQAKTQVSQTLRDYNRAQRLARTGDLAKAALEKAQHAHNMARLQLSAARAQLRRTGRSLSDSRVRVPFDGVVYQRHVEVGTYLMPGTPVLTLMEVDRLKLVVGIQPDHAAMLKPGMTAAVTIEGFGRTSDGRKRTLAGKVHLVRPAADAQTRLVDVEFEIGNRGRTLRPGVAARVSVPMGTPSARVFIRADAVVEMMKIQYAYVVKDGKAVRRRVTLGAEEGNMVEVTKGLAVGEQLVTVGQNRLVPNVPVRIVPDKSAEPPRAAGGKDKAARPADSRPSPRPSPM